MKFNYRYLIIIFALLFLSCEFGFAGSFPYHVVWRDYEEGVKFARETKKPLMIAFFSERCRYCKLMDKVTFNDLEVVKTLNEKFVSVKVDIGQNGDLARLYMVSALPTIWFLTSEGEGIGRIFGYHPPRAFLPVLEYIGDGYYEKMVFEDFMRTRGKGKR